ncbi:MAG: diacylglycerol kinase family lipid kinase [Chloroflexi bacterium]|nr:diacylglycerol kinase family lipid kinase [Chloroflexota bacterium]MCI0576649.1 diacylglycerol kinase family lipid kinase [Chloroflexota bacterium]MCI0646983.1 diacylglycerol kinase family lipid kinase [Chloroflexota bacterium]MCI0729258.1 diacylglycerol kinase family lipid kinase [Chloroflexota bacterium]
MKIIVILNPYANRWKAQGKAPAIEAACAAAGLEYTLIPIPAPGQGRQLAIEAATDGYDAIVAAGGDGTVNEVVNGLIVAAGDGPTRPLGVLPIGTGNDLSDMAGLPRDLAAAAQVIAAGQTRQIDAGRVTADGRVHFFDNNCAVAMEPMVTLENIRMTRLSGNIRYIVALARALLRLKAWQMRIAWDDGGYEGPAYLLSVCNSARTGGLFPMAPSARLDDGLFDFVFAPEVPKQTVLAILARLFRGTHVHHPRITYGRSAHLEIESHPGTPIHADGELIAEAANHITYDILPGKITLLSP